jgi:hypothetical protein
LAGVGNEPDDLGRLSVDVNEGRRFDHRSVEVEDGVALVERLAVNGLVAGSIRRPELAAEG